MQLDSTDGQGEFGRAGGHSCVCVCGREREVEKRRNARGGVRAGGQMAD
jgi:hypothetical protein